MAYRLIQRCADAPSKHQHRFTRLLWHMHGHIWVSFFFYNTTEIHSFPAYSSFFLSRFAMQFFLFIAVVCLRQLKVTERFDQFSDCNWFNYYNFCQCLMYLYHHPDIWYDYAMWHAKNGSIDSAAKIFQRALKAIPGNIF